LKGDLGADEGLFKKVTGKGRTQIGKTPYPWEKNTARKKKRGGGWKNATRVMTEKNQSQL